MRSLKIMMVCSIFAMAFAITGCKKEKFQSRDTSGIKAPPVDTTPVTPVDPTLVVFDNADSKDGWETVGSVNITTPGQKEGAGYIKNTISNGGDFMQFIKHLPTPLDSKLTLLTGQFSFWWYISDVSLLKNDGQIEITSGGDADKHEFGWQISKLLPTLKNGWNQLNLNFRDADISGGDPDPSAFNFFRIYFWTTSKDHADLVTGIDDLVLRAVPPPPPVVIDNCDALDGWNVAGGTQALITKGQKEGTGYLQGTIKTGEDFMQFIKTLPAPVNTNVTMATGQLDFWLYVQDVSVLKVDGQIQFSSANDPDNKRIGWGMDKIIPNLKNGWNHLQLNFTDGYVSGDGGPDLTAMNFIKVFFWTAAKATSDQNYGIDDIKVVAH